MTSRARSGRLLLRKVAASVATVAVAGGLMGFAHYGRIADPHDPFPRSLTSSP